MKTINQHQKSGLKAILILIGLMAFAVFLASIFFHMKPSVLANTIIDFSTHHYFLMGFISVIVLLFCYKFYITLSEQIEKDQVYRKQGMSRSQIIGKHIRSVNDKWYRNTDRKVSEFVDKFKVSELIFDKGDVLQSEEEKSKREESLTKAMMLGNSVKHKVRIYFRDRESDKHIETTIWHANSNHISLKGGLVLPVRSIYKVEI